MEHGQIDWHFAPWIRGWRQEMQQREAERFCEMVEERSQTWKKPPGNSRGPDLARLRHTLSSCSLLAFLGSGDLRVSLPALQLCPQLCCPVVLMGGRREQGIRVLQRAWLRAAAARSAQASTWQGTSQACRGEAGHLAQGEPPRPLWTQPGEALCGVLQFVYLVPCCRFGTL